MSWRNINNLFMIFNQLIFLIVFTKKNFFNYSDTQYFYRTSFYRKFFLYSYPVAAIHLFRIALWNRVAHVSLLIQQLAELQAKKQ